MRVRPWPSVAKVADFRLDIAPHFRGGESRYGHHSYERASGAHFAGELALVPMRTDDALTVRAFLHSLRGQSGTFVLGLYYNTTGGLVPTAPGSIAPALVGTSSYSDGGSSGEPMGLLLTLTGGGAGGIIGFSDGTVYADSAATETTLSGAAAADAATISVTSATGFVVGRIVSVAGQLCRVVSVAGTTIGIRPRLRAAAASGARVVYQGAEGLFRLDDETPAIPLIVGRSNGFSLKIREAY